MAICKRCNAQISDDAKFCTSCGAVVEETLKKSVESAEQKQEDVLAEKVEETVTNEEKIEKEKPAEDITIGTSVAQNQKVDNNSFSQTTQYTPVAPPANAQNTYNSQQAYQTQYAKPQYKPPVVNTDVEPPRNSKYAPVSTGKWFGLTLLLSIPVVGFVTWIVLMCSKNVNLKNYAKSVLIWFIINVVLTVISAVLCFTLFRAPIEGIIDDIKSAYSTFADYNDNNYIENNSDYSEEGTLYNGNDSSYNEYDYVIDAFSDYGYAEF